MKVVPIIVLVAATAFAQTTPQQQGPWSEQPPLAQAPRPLYGPPGQPGYAPPGPQDGPAQNGPDDQSDYDPNRGVARISVMNGNVSVRRGDSGELVAAILNAPLTVGDRVVTGDGGRAEVELDFANLIRLGPSTEVRLSQLSQRQYQIQIATGTALFRVLRDTDAQIEISTPTVAVHPLRRGIYRVTVKPDGSSDVTVRAGGDSQVVSPAGSEDLHSGQTMMTRGSSNDPEFQIVAPLPEDELDRWSASRDRQLTSARSPEHVNRGIYGTEDMDQYGHWENDGTYGSVWVPTVGPGWAPYQCGRWVWLDYYGWTWMGCEPWARAPYHYGRWYFGAYGWSWWPGPVVSFTFWRPALVGFFGFGAPGFGVGFGFGYGSVGWVPLAPFEAFHAWYGPHYYGGFGGVHVVGGFNAAVYRNARVTNGITAVRANEFGRAGVSTANLVRPTSQELAHAGAVRGQLPVGPSRESTAFTNRTASTAGLPRTSDTMRFAGRSTSVNRVPFAEQQRSFSQAASRGFAGSANSGGFRGGAPSAPQSSSGWQRMSPGGSSSGSASGAYRPPASQPSYNRNAPAQSAPRQVSPQQPVRINPPIVNRGAAPRSAPSRSSGGGSHGGGAHGGGGGRH